MEKSDLSHHILSRFNEDLERVRTQVLQMGGLVEEQFKRAVEALIEGDSRAGEEVARNDHNRRRLQPYLGDTQSRRVGSTLDCRRHQNHHRPGTHRR